ncbi:calcium/sodium antiporter [bacterium]|nr:calcium/sodium antiporter [bacterium]
MFGDTTILFLGLLGLFIGANSLVKGGVELALIARIRPIVIGLTIIAVGTSLPELTVSVVSAANNSMGISIGNIIGSNICNILLILGVTALIRPIPIERKALREDVPTVIMVSVVLWMLAQDGVINRFDGIILILLYVLFLVHSFSSKTDDIREKIVEKGFSKFGKSIIFVILGLGLLAFGGWATVKGGMNIATSLGVPDSIIALTLIAFGTSLPELATSAVASIKNKSDIAVGNILGSNICNSLFVIGVAGIMKPFSIPLDILQFSFPMMLFASVAMFPFVKSGRSLNRLEGAFFVVSYLVYCVALMI